VSRVPLHTDRDCRREHRNSCFCTTLCSPSNSAPLPGYREKVPPETLLASSLLQFSGGLFFSLCRVFALGNNRRDPLQRRLTASEDPFAPETNTRGFTMFRKAWRALAQAEEIRVPPANSSRGTRTRGLKLENLEDRLALATWFGDIFDNHAPARTLWTNGQVQEITGDVHVPAGKTAYDSGGGLSSSSTAANQLTVDAARCERDGHGRANDRLHFHQRQLDRKGAATPPSPGIWSNIVFNSGSMANVLDHVVVRYGGSKRPSRRSVRERRPANAEQQHAQQLRLERACGWRIPSPERHAQREHFHQQRPNAAAHQHRSGFQSDHQPGETAASVHGPMPRSGLLPGHRARCPQSLNWTNPDIVYVMTTSITVPTGMTLTVGAGQVVKMRGRADGEWLAAGPGRTATNPAVFHASVKSTTPPAATQNNNGHGRSRPGRRLGRHPAQFHQHEQHLRSHPNSIRR